MRPRTTNISAKTSDVYNFSFESTGALSSLTNTQGLPSHRLTYIDFEELKTACP